MKIILNTDEIDILFRSNSGQGGFQSLLTGLQEKTNKQTGELNLSDSDLERISRYAFNYENGGWQDRLRGIFERHLGPDLGR